MSIRTLKDSYKKISQLKKNVLSGTVFSVGNIVINFIAYPVYLKYLGAEQYGLWTTIAVVFTFSQFGQMGMERALTKYVASEYGDNNLKGITEYISTSFYILLVPSFIILILLAVARFYLADLFRLNDIFRNDAVPLIFLVGVLSVFSFFVNVIKGAVVGIGRMDIANYYTLLSRVLQIILNISLFVFGMGIWSLYYGFVLYYICPLVLWGVMLSRTYNIKIFDPLSFSREKMKELIKFGGTLSVGMIAQMLVTPFNKVIIARYIGLTEVAYYQIATQVVVSARSLFARGLESIFPKVSELYGENLESIKSIISVRNKGLKVVFLFAFPLFILIFIFAEIILTLWLGEAFNMQIADAMRILLIGWLIHSLAVPDCFVFLGVGKVGYSVGATCLRSATNVIFVTLFILLNVNITFNKIVIIDSMSLIAEVLLVKYLFFKFKKSCEFTQSSLAKN